MTSPFPITLANFSTDYRELSAGEAIALSDLLLPTNKTEFQPFKTNSRAIGYPYKDVNTKLLPTTIVIRNKKIPIRVDIFGVNLSKDEAIIIAKIVANHPLYSDYDGASRLRERELKKNFYILNYNPVYGMNNCVGFTSDKQMVNKYFTKAVTMDFKGVMEFLETGKVVKIKYNSMSIRVEMELTLTNWAT